MLLLAFACVCLLGALALHYFLVAERKLILGPETFFLIMGVGTFAATVGVAAESGPLPHPYPLFMSIGLILFVLGTVASNFVLGFRHRAALAQFKARPWVDDLSGLQLALVFLIGVIGLIVTAWFFSTIGFYMPLEALTSLKQGGVEAVNEVHLRRTFETRQVGTYAGAGYVHQFKNCLLPLVTLLLYLRARSRPSLAHWTTFAFFLMATVLGLVGLGKRGPLVYSAAAFVLVGIAGYMWPFNFSRRQTAIVGLIALVLLSSLTLMIGTRGAERIVDYPILWAPFQLVDRALTGPARERFIAYELFLEDSEPQFGQGVLKDLKILLPGQADYTLSNELSELVYGSAVGNVGFDIWGTLWYELQWAGLIGAFLLGFALHWYYVRLLTGPKRFTRVVTLAYAGLLLGLVEHVMNLLNVGFFSLMLFLLLVNGLRTLHGAIRRSGDRGSRPSTDDSIELGRQPAG